MKKFSGSMPLSTVESPLRQCCRAATVSEGIRTTPDPTSPRPHRVAQRAFRPIFSGRVFDTVAPNYDPSKEPARKGGGKGGGKGKGKGGKKPMQNE
jgi:hypothetical protein